MQRYQTDPVYHEVESAGVTVEEMTHHFLRVHQMDRVKIAARIARSVDRTIMFVATKRGCDRLAEKLREEGVTAAAIHGDLRQSDREKALAGFMAGKVSVLVATDVAARGIHVDDVGMVVHWDPSDDHKSYLHRSGRTACRRHWRGRDTAVVGSGTRRATPHAPPGPRSGHRRGVLQ